LHHGTLGKNSNFEWLPCHRSASPVLYQKDLEDNYCAPVESTQLVRLINSDSNTESVIFMTNYFFNERRHQQCYVLMTDFVNLNIKSTQSFKCAYKDKFYVHVFIEMNAYIYI
jgi:hypothetical protein